MLDLLSTEAEVGYYYAADKIIYMPPWIDNSDRNCYAATHIEHSR